MTHTLFVTRRAMMPSFPDSVWFAHRVVMDDPIATPARMIKVRIAAHRAAKREALWWEWPGLLDTRRGR